jgi:hypothetical protein
MLIAIIISPVVMATAGIYSCMKCELLRYQESKIATMSDVDTLFLGDSSIGYALDAKEFSALSGRKTLSLPLTGWNYGIAGAYVLLNEVLAHTHPKNVVFAFTPQTFVYSIAKLHDLPMQGFVQTARWRPRLLFTINDETSSAATTMVSAELQDRTFMEDGLKFLVGLRPALSGDFRKYDYLAPSAARLDLKSVEVANFGPGPPHDYDAYFAKTAELCRAHGLNCLYTHALMLDTIVAQNHPFIRDLGDRIEAAGIKVIRQSPIEIPAADIGNTMNHVRSDLRPAYTEKIYRLIKDSLR